MAREKSVKIRLTELEEKFINQEAERLGISKSEFIRRLLTREIEKCSDTKNKI